MKTLHCIVTGKHQDEYFLAWIEEQATSCGLTGWARHLDDQRVEVTAQGDEKACRDLLLRLMNGSVITGMNNVQEEWLDEPAKHKVFEIR